VKKYRLSRNCILSGVTFYSEPPCTCVQYSTLLTYYAAVL